jgi:acetylornithine aminotransferase/acetylornithine/N-succinyldiaminopimelate aminotransferase
MKAAKIRRLEKRHLMNTYKRPPVVFTHGKGCALYDERGRAYLDFLGGIAVNALGHAHPRMVRVIRRQAARAVHVSNLFHNEFQGPLARKLAEWSGLDRVFFTNSGSEAMDGALKLARVYAKKNTPEGTAPRTRILALEHSFHGRTFGALSITSTAKYREPFEPLVPGAEFVRFNDVADLEAKLDSTVCALVLEPVQGEGGIRSVSEAFYNRARQLCTEQNAALIADEIQCGLGRTGLYFAYQKFAAPPDIAVVAKPLAGGLPLGAILANEKFAAAFTPGLHGTTFGGGPLACAAALEFLTIVEEEKLLANIRARGAELRAGFEALASKFDFVREVRGEGLMLGLELSVDGNVYARAALKRGLVINCTHDRVLRFLPPFIVRAQQVKDFLARLEVVLAKTPRPKPEAATETKTAPATSRKAMAATR